MPIIKAETHRDVYRLRATKPDIHELNGRGQDRRATDIVVADILHRMGDPSGRAVLDVGCGDGSLLRAIAGQASRAVGVAPSQEEVSRLKDYHSGAPITFVCGIAEQLPFAESIFDWVVLHGVITILPSMDAVRAAISEAARVVKSDGLVWIGSVPDCDENAYFGRSFGDSIVGWLWYTFRRNGLGAASRSANEVIRAVIGRDEFIIQPKDLFICAPADFLKLAAAAGLSSRWHGRLRMNDGAGTARDSLTRYNYLLAH